MTSDDTRRLVKLVTREKTVLLGEMGRAGTPVGRRTVLTQQVVVGPVQLQLELQWVLSRYSGFLLSPVLDTCVTCSLAAGVNE